MAFFVDFLSYFSIGPPCKGHLDLGIILDKSKSIKKSNLKKLKRSLADFVDKFEVSAERTHVGLISFNDDAELLFDFNRYHTNKELKRAIEKIPEKLEYETRTDLALTMAKNKLFTEAGGDRSDVPNVLIIFTDGKSTGKPWQKGYVPITKTVRVLTEVNVHASIYMPFQISIRLSIRPSSRPSVPPPIHLFDAITVVQY